MAYLIIFVFIAISVGVLLILEKYKKLNIKLTIKMLSILLFGLFTATLFKANALDNVFNLFLVDIKTEIDAFDTWLLPVGMTTWIIFLRWLTGILVTFAIINSFVGVKSSKYLVTFISPLIIIFNLIFFKQHVILVVGNYDLWNYRSILMMFQNGVLAVLVITSWFKMIQEKLWPTKKEVGFVFLLLLASLFFMMPQSILYNFFGNYGKMPENFNLEHIFVILVALIITLVIYFGLKNKSKETKEMFLTFLVFAAFFQYFSVEKPGLTGLPLHLCNTAIILLVLAYTFKSRGIFYFTYFGNVLGALIAILIPSYDWDFFNIRVIGFGYNHMYAFMLPILSVALHIFARPKLKDMAKAIGYFTLYYVFIVFINAWLNNYQSIDYFFAYRNHITKMFGLEKIQYDFVASFTINGLTFKFFYLYQLLFYIAFIFLMFVSWYIYDLAYQMIDNQAALLKKQGEIKEEMRKLKLQLGNKNINEPINPEGIDKISIRNFTKRYGSSKRKAVDNFSLEINSGEVYGFLGHNGAGKSTTIKSLVGIQSITEGEMEICGYSIKSQPMQAKLLIGYVSDNHAVYERLTGREYINYVADLYNVSQEDREERLNLYLEKYMLSHAIDQEIKSYSHGMKQKLVVIASLIHNPRVWILDEPLTGLDPTSSFQIKETMREHADNGNIVFFSSHVIEVVEKICDKICIINAGKLQGIYNVKELLDKGISLETLYMSQTEIAKDIEATYEEEKNNDINLNNEKKKLKSRKKAKKTSKEIKTV